jgi:hypothetical protein
MSRKLESLFPNVSKMSDEQLTDYIREIRRRKYIERPAKVRHAEKEEKIATTKKVSSVTKLVKGLTEEQLQTMIAQLEGDS